MTHDNAGSLAEDTNGLVSRDLSELTAVDIRRYLESRTTVLIPIGSTEQHGRHLPLCTDVITATAIARRVSDQVGVLHTPTVWTGYSPQHMFEAGSGRGTITLRSSTLQALLLDIGRSLIHTGFDRLIFINGHGGNQLVIDPVLRKLRADTGAMIGFVQAIIEGGMNPGLFTGILDNEPDLMPGGHGSELETSQVLAWDHRLVRMDRVRPAPVSTPAHLSPAFAPPGGRPGIVFEGHSHFRFALNYDDISELGTSGDATSATADKGERAFSRLADHVARGVIELEQIKVDVHSRDFVDCYL